MDGDVMGEWAVWRGTNQQRRVAASLLEQSVVVAAGNAGGVLPDGQPPLGDFFRARR